MLREGIVLVVLGILWWATGSLWIAALLAAILYSVLLVFDALQEATGSSVLALILTALGLGWLFGGDDGGDC
jgi:hypothetical protein